MSVANLDWVIEKDMFPENEEGLARILGERLVWCQFTVNGPIFTKQDNSEISLDTNFVFYGSIHAGRRLQRTHNAICWLYDKVYDCNEYLPKFGNFALNNPHIFVEAGGLRALQKELGETKYFIKENSGYKHFTGGVYTPFFQDELDKLFDEELLLLAPAKQIGAEWRFVISSNEIDDVPHRIISYSLYGEVISEANPVPFVEQVLQDPRVRSYQPAPMSTIDVCEVGGGFAVVEVNSLLSAGWYKADVAAIVNEVDRQIGVMV